MPSLDATFYLDTDHPAVRAFVDETVDPESTDREKAVALYYRVRDEIRYEPYKISFAPEAMKASATLEREDGFCVAKSVLLGAGARAAGIPARLGFADVRNHLATRKLLDALGSDIFIWHGYTELHIDGKWVKATPAFNLSLCEKAGVRPLEFDGTEDSIFHEFDVEGNRHMEYVADHGSFEDLPLERLVDEYRAFYPAWTANLEGDFEDETAAESQAAVRT
jgi:transglutaminase-like putative cysteine protease